MHEWPTVVNDSPTGNKPKARLNEVEDQLNQIEIKLSEEK